jgi:hypothetical protein
MEFLPPPPPHLLHSDDDEEAATAVAVVEQGGEEVVTKRGLSVAESVRELQRRQSQQAVGAARPSSPATLRYGTLDISLVDPGSSNFCQCGSSESGSRSRV